MKSNTFIERAMLLNKILASKKGYKYKRRFYSHLNNQLYNTLLKRGALYRQLTNKIDIHNFQVKQFNKVWFDAYNKLPFYREWKIKHNLPHKIESLLDLESWPILRKKDLQQNKVKLNRKDINPSGYLKTGGSTGEPLHLPTWKDQYTASSMWLGRAAYGIEPGMKTFLIWGHHHLNGRGLSRQLSMVKRHIKDCLSNMYRVSAYDLSRDAMKKAHEQYVSFEPEFVIGFSPSILSFCRINEKQQNGRHSPKAILCTAGPLSPTEIKEIEYFFEAPVCMEYGSVECGVIAYTNPTNREYKVFWDTHLVQGLEDHSGMVRNIVTRLVPCYFPMIRYDIGDYLKTKENKKFESIIKFKTVLGRPSDIIEIGNGNAFFSALVGDCTKQIEGIIATQLHVLKNALRIEVVSTRSLRDKDFTQIRNRLTTVIPQIKQTNLTIIQVESLHRTIGGKTPQVVRHNQTIGNVGT